MILIEYYLDDSKLMIAKLPTARGLTNLSIFGMSIIIEILLLNN